MEGTMDQQHFARPERGPLTGLGGRSKFCLAAPLACVLSLTAVEAGGPRPPTKLAPKPAAPAEAKAPYKQVLRSTACVFRLANTPKGPRLKVAGTAWLEGHSGKRLL